MGEEAAQGLSASGTSGAAADQQKMKELIVQVAQMLQQGRSPEELMQMGVPQEIIQAAMQLLKQSQGSDGDGDEPQTGGSQQMQQGLSRG